MNGPRPKRLAAPVVIDIDRLARRAVARATPNHRDHREKLARDSAIYKANERSSARGLLADPLQPLISRLSNWQRKQWARAGYPKSAKQLTEFATMQRPRAA